MSSQDRQESEFEKGNFEQQAGQRQVGLLREFAYFLKHNKKWWLTPILMTLLLIMGLVILGSTAVAPFIYTLF